MSHVLPSSALALSFSLIGLKHHKVVYKNVGKWTKDCKALICKYLDLWASFAPNNSLKSDHIKTET